MTISLSHTLVDGAAIDADDLQDNFDDIVEALGNITNAMIASGAGITSDKLADRYTVDQPSFPILPYGSDNDFSDARAVGNAYLVPTSATTIYAYRVCLASGEDGYLCAVHVYLNYSDRNGGDVRIGVFVNGVQVGGDYITMDGIGSPNGFYKLAKSNPISNYLLALADNDLIEIKLTATAGTPACSGLTVSPVIKKELVS